MGRIKMRKHIVLVALAIAAMAVATTPPGIAETAAPKPLTPQQQKLKDCGAAWQQMKKDGTTNGQTWANVRRDCLRKK